MVLVLLPAAFFWRSLSGRLVPAGYDLLTYTYPYRVAAATAVRQGRLPFWNPDLFAGVPFLANIQSAVLYPFNLLFVWPGGPQMLTVSMVFHLVLTGLFFHLFCRRALDLGPWAALTGAAAFSAGGFALAHSEQLNQNNALAWAPLVVLAVDQAYRLGTARWAAVLALALALQILAGHPQVVYYTALLSATWLVALVIRSRRERAGALRRLGWPVAGALVGALLAAVQLVPTAELARLSIRGGGLSYADAASFALPVRGVLGAFLPDYTSELNTEWAGYVGFAALLLAVLGLVTWRRDARGVALAIASLLAACLALGAATPLFGVAYHLLPGMSDFRGPARMMMISTFGLSALAAVGAEAFQRRRLWDGHTWAAPLLVGVVVLVAFAAARLLWRPGPARNLVLLFPTPTGRRQLAAWILILAVGVALAWLSRRGRAVGPAMAAVVVLELFLAGQPMNPLHPLPAGLYQRDQRLDRLLPGAQSGHRSLSVARPQDVTLPAGHDPRWRFYQAFRATDQPDYPMQGGRATLDGYDGGVLPLAPYVAFRRLLVPAGSANQAGYPFPLLTSRPLAPRLLGLMGVKYVLVSDPAALGELGRSYTRVATVDGVTVLRNADALPRAFVVHSLLPAAGAAADRAALAGSAFTPGSEAVAPAGACKVAPAGAQDEVRLVTNRPERVAIRATIGSAGLLVVTDASYPGWRATVDGRPAPIATVDMMLQGVCLGPGSHTVVLTFEPSDWQAAVALSLGGAALVLALLAWPALGRRRAGGRG